MLRKNEKEANIIVAKLMRITFIIFTLVYILNVKRSSDDVAVSMKQINDNTQENCNAVEQVTASSQENAAGTESLAEIVEQIRMLSEQLNKVVQG